MSLFGHDSTGDLDRGPDGRGFVRVTGQEEARVRLETNLRLVQGEVKLDSRAGLDHTFLFDPATRNSHRANHLASVMVSQPGIVDAQLRYEINAELGKMDVTAETTYSEADQNGRRKRQEQFVIEQGQDVGGTS